MAWSVQATAPATGPLPPAPAQLRGKGLCVRMITVWRAWTQGHLEHLCALCRLLPRVIAIRLTITAVVVSTRSVPATAIQMVNVTATPASALASKATSAKTAQVSNA
jgi:hypothetical protein